MSHHTDPNMQSWRSRMGEEVSQAFYNEYYGIDDEHNPQHAAMTLAYSGYLATLIFAAIINGSCSCERQVSRMPLAN